MHEVEDKKNPRKVGEIPAKSGAAGPGGVRTGLRGGWGGADGAGRRLRGGCGRMRSGCWVGTGRRLRSGGCGGRGAGGPAVVGRRLGGAVGRCGRCGRVPDGNGLPADEGCWRVRADGCGRVDAAAGVLAVRPSSGAGSAGRSAAVGVAVGCRMGTGCRQTRVAGECGPTAAAVRPSLGAGLAGRAAAAGTTAVGRLRSGRLCRAGCR